MKIKNERGEKIAQQCAKLIIDDEKDSSTVVAILEKENVMLWEVSAIKSRIIEIILQQP